MIYLLSRPKRVGMRWFKADLVVHSILQTLLAT
jgi:hypothetical protein